MNTNQKIILKALNQTGCVDADFISCYIKRKFNETITKSQVTGALRPLVAKGMVGKSNCGYGKNVYWINENYPWKEDKNYE